MIVFLSLDRDPSDPDTTQQQYIHYSCEIDMQIGCEAVCIVSVDKSLEKAEVLASKTFPCSVIRCRFNDAVLITTATDPPGFLEPCQF
jgi:hypothetical protein